MRGGRGSSISPRPLLVEMRWRVSPSLAMRPSSAAPFGGAPQAWPSPASDRGAPGAAMPRLVAIAGPYAGQVFPLPPVGGSIGREAAREVALTADGTVSRRHASIALEGGAFMLPDEGSSNGTFVNNQRVQQQVLRSGDEIRIGARLFRFEA